MTKKVISEIELINEIASIVKSENLSEVEIEKDGIRIKVQNQNSETKQAIQYVSNPVTHQPAIPPAQTPAIEIKAEQSAVNDPTDSGQKTYIKSPMVGTCYLSPEPGSKPFVSIGSKINKGDPIIIIEAMKTFNTIPCTESGVVKSILVEEGQPIEFGQNIIEIE
jgi:acetyl-CoA carboxylase biotin carboxyl carrier protein